MRIYVGTYTRGESEGIYLLELDPATGSLTSRGLAAATDNPSFLAIHPTGKYLYAVNEVGRYQGQPSRIGLRIRRRCRDRQALAAERRGLARGRPLSHRHRREGQARPDRQLHRRERGGIPN